VSSHSKVAKALAKQEQNIANEKQWWADQNARVESGDLIGYYTAYISKLEDTIKQVGGFSSTYRQVCLGAMKATLVALQNKE
jgi:hypothetical protein